MQAGLDTVLGERGTLISGGERQRLCLARAVLRRPWLYRLGTRLASIALRPFARGGWLTRLPGPGGG